MISRDYVGTLSISSGTAGTLSHIVSGGNRFLTLGAAVPTATETISGATYNGIAMTQIAHKLEGNTHVYLFDLVNPALGTNNIIISLSGTTDIRATSVSYKGARQYSQPDSFGSISVNSGTTLTGTANVVTNNSWVVGVIGNDGNLAMTPGAGVGSVSGTVANVFTMADSNAAKQPGANTMNWTFGTQSAALCMLSIAPSDDGLLGGEI